MYPWAGADLYQFQPFHGNQSDFQHDFGMQGTELKGIKHFLNLA